MKETIGLNLLLAMNLLFSSAQASEAPVVQQIGEAAFLGFPNQIYFLAYVVGSLLVLIVAMWKLIWNNESKKLDDAIEKIDALVGIMTQVKTKVEHLERDKVTEHQVKDLARHEINHFFDMVSKAKNRL